MDCQQFPSLAFKALCYWQLFWHWLPHSLINLRGSFPMSGLVWTLQGKSKRSLISINLVSNYSVDLIERVNCPENISPPKLAVSDWGHTKSKKQKQSSNMLLHMKDFLYFSSSRVWGGSGNKWCHTFLCTNQHLGMFESKSHGSNGVVSPKLN